MTVLDRVPADNPGAREIGFALPERYNASRILFDNLAAGRGDNLALTGPPRHPHLCAVVRGGVALGPRLSGAGADARRSYPDVSRRHAGLSRGILWGGACGPSAAPDQYADPARSPAVLPGGFRRDGCCCGGGVRHASSMPSPARRRNCAR